MFRVSPVSPPYEAMFKDFSDFSVLQLATLWYHRSPNGIFLWKEHFCFETAVIWVVWETTTMFNILPFAVYTLLTPQFAHSDTMLLAAPNKGGRRHPGASPFYFPSFQEGRIVKNNNHIPPLYLHLPVAYCINHYFSRSVWINPLPIKIHQITPKSTSITIFPAFLPNFPSIYSWNQQFPMIFPAFSHDFHSPSVQTHPQ